MADDLTPRVITGANAVFSVNGKKIGTATGVSATFSYRTSPIFVLGTPIAQGRPIVQVDGSMTADLVHIKNEDPVSLGLSPKADAVEITGWKAVDALLLDRNNTVLGTAVAVTPREKTVGGSAGAIFTRRMSFDFNLWRDQSE